MTPRRYSSDIDDSARWDDFEFRHGDIVITASSKAGTTWTQMICALLVFQTPDLPAPLTTLSPWLDMRIHPSADVLKRLASQEHRRIVKTHTPIDGIPIHPLATYIAVCRHPLDAAVSKIHQQDNLHYDRIFDLVEQAEGVTWDDDDEDDAGDDGATLRDRLMSWIDEKSPPHDRVGLAGFVWQMRVAWERAGDSNVVLLHYADLTRDLEREMRRLAQRLQISVPEATWPRLVEAARFDAMKQRAAQLVPDERAGIMKSVDDFFRAGTSGQWRSVLSDEDLRRYQERIAELASPELLAYLHAGRVDSGIP
jgi:aryl sulfotransferase